MVGSDFDCNRFLKELSVHFRCDQPAEVQYLKKNIIITADGIVIEPCKKYIPKLLELLHVENRREKSCPHHINLEVYDRNKVLVGELLSPEQEEA